MKDILLSRKEKESFLLGAVVKTLSQSGVSPNNAILGFESIVECVTDIELSEGNFKHRFVSIANILGLEAEDLALIVKHDIVYYFVLIAEKSATLGNKNEVWELCRQLTGKTAASSQALILTGVLGQFKNEFFENLGEFYTDKGADEVIRYLKGREKNYTCTLVGASAVAEKSSNEIVRLAENLDAPLDSYGYEELKQIFIGYGLSPHNSFDFKFNDSDPFIICLPPNKDYYYPLKKGSVRIESFKHFEYLSMNRGFLQSLGFNSKVINEVPQIYYFEREGFHDVSFNDHRWYYGSKEIQSREHFRSMIGKEEAEFLSYIDSELEAKSEFVFAPLGPVLFEQLGFCLRDGLYIREGDKDSIVYHQEQWLYAGKVVKTRVELLKLVRDKNRLIASKFKESLGKTGHLDRDTAFGGLDYANEGTGVVKMVMPPIILNSFISCYANIIKGTEGLAKYPKLAGVSLSNAEKALRVLISKGTQQNLSGLDNESVGDLLIGFGFDSIGSDSVYKRKGFASVYHYEKKWFFAYWGDEAKLIETIEELIQKCFPKEKGVLKEESVNVSEDENLIDDYAVRALGFDKQEGGCYYRDGHPFIIVDKVGNWYYGCTQVFGYAKLAELVEEKEKAVLKAQSNKQNIDKFVEAVKHLPEQIRPNYEDIVEAMEAFEDKSECKWSNIDFIPFGPSYFQALGFKEYAGKESYYKDGHFLIQEYKGDWFYGNQKISTKSELLPLVKKRDKQIEKKKANSVKGGLPKENIKNLEEKS